MFTLAEHPVHCNLLPGAPREAGLGLGVLQGLDVPAVVGLGCYGDSYEPYLPAVLVRVPALAAAKVFPDSLLRSLDRAWPEWRAHADAVDVACAVGDWLDPDVPPGPSVNVIAHAWLLHQDIEVTDDAILSTTAAMGAFALSAAVHPLCKLPDVAVLDAMPVERLDTREVCIHHRCFSPNNADLGLRPTAQAGVATFWTCVVGGRIGEVPNRAATIGAPARAAVTLHALPLTREARGQLNEALVLTHSRADLKSDASMVSTLAAALHRRSHWTGFGRDLAALAVACGAEPFRL